jgi:hypothetical protein
MLLVFASLLGAVCSKVGGRGFEDSSRKRRRDAGRAAGRYEGEEVQAEERSDGVFEE